MSESRIEQSVDRYLGSGMDDAAGGDSSNNEQSSTPVEAPRVPASPDSGQREQPAGGDPGTAGQQVQQGGASGTGQPGPAQQRGDRTDSGTPGGSEHQQRSADVVTANPAQRAYYKADAEGNLLDPNNRIVARAGNERKYFEIARTNHTRLTDATRELQDVRRERDDAVALNTLPRQLGLTNDELTNAARFMAHWKQDLPGAARKMLAEALASGHTIEGLAPGLDTAAIKHMMDERLAPFATDRQRAEEEQRRAADSAQQVQRLFDEMPWAEANQQEIATVMDAYPNDTMREAAMRVQMHAMQYGFDLSRSIAEQTRARNAGGQQAPQAAQPVQQRASNARAPVPAGPGAAPTIPTRNNGLSMDARSSTRDILRSAFAEQGVPMPEGY